MQKHKFYILPLIWYNQTKKLVNMLTSKQFCIFGRFLRNIYGEYTYQEIKGNEKSNNLIQLAIKKFKHENLIREKEIGTSKLYSLNLETHKSYLYLELTANMKLHKEAKISLDILRKEIDRFTVFYSLVVFGSFAKSQNKKDSDLDIAVFINRKELVQKMKIAANSANNKSLLNMDVHVFTEEEFLQLLKADYANLAKEIAYNNLPVHNALIFYKILARGVNNGFKIVS